MSHRAPEGLTNPRDMAKHNHDTFLWVIVAGHRSKATNSSKILWQATHDPPTH